MKNGSFYLIFIFVIFQSCHDPCEDFTTNIGTIKLTTYDKSVLINIYPTNQTIKFLRNKTDTIILNSANQYFSKKTITTPIDVNDCRGSYGDIENQGIYLNSTLKNTGFYLFTSSIYSKKHGFFDFVKPSDTLSYLEFGIYRGGNLVGNFEGGKYYGNIFGGSNRTIQFKADDFQDDSKLIDSFLVNYITYYNVFYYKKTNHYWGIDELYFHPKYGVIKFSIYSENSLKTEGDIYELIR